MPAMIFCRTLDEIFQAGWDDGADDPPLTDAEIDRLIVLWRRSELLAARATRPGQGVGGGRPRKA